MAVPTFIAASSASTNTASNTVTCTYPAGSASGDLLVMFAGFQRSPTSGTQTLTTPSGWTLLDTQQNSSTYGQVSASYWRFRGAETSVSVVASNSTSQYGTVQIHAYAAASVDATTPVGISAIAAQSSPTGSTAARPCPSVTTTSADNAISCFAAISSLSSGRTFSWGITERTDAYAGANADLYLTSATTSQASPGATGVFNITPSAGVDELHTATIAIQPPQLATVTDGDTGAGADDAVTAATTTGSDTGVGSEAATQKVTATTDTGAGAETASVAAGLPAADTGSGAEAATTTASTPGSDTGSGADTAAVAVAVSGADTGSGLDTASVRIQAAGDTGSGVDTQVGFAQDTGVGAEAAAIRSAATDTGTGTDTAFATNTAQTADTGSGVDAAQTRLPVSDLGSGADTAQLSAKANAADTGAATEGATVIVISAGESGSGVDQATIRFTVGDTAGGVDAGSIRVTVFGSDSVSGADDTAIGPTGAADSGQFTDNAFKAVSGFLDNPRVIKVEPDDRVVRILRDNRTYEIESEFRTVFIGFEDRRIIRVVDEERTVSIPREV